MNIAPGTRLGPYEIVGAIGAGGMGEVYRARDTRLDRPVAIKVLPPHLASDPQLRDRFEREARAISSLNHPHICALFDVGRADGAESARSIDYLVLELLEGQTLAERLRAGPLPVADALRCAIEIASALDKAHRAGIVHRDLKPANVMLTKSGAKVLDFGLAKSSAPVVAGSGLSMLPTTPPNLTAQGTILGTFQYMAPEQIEGAEADARTDIFAFGALLFEMIAGRPAFEGKTRASLLGAILKDDPPRVSTVQPIAPRALDRVISQCLAKDPDDRWQSARDVVHELRWIASGDATEPAPIRARSRSSRVWIALAVVGSAAAIALAAALWLRPSASVGEPIQFTIAVPENSSFGAPPGGGTGIAPQFAVSPNGRHVVFVALSQTKYFLWHRPIDGVAATLIPGTEDASFPFWSPDSRFVGFFANGKLRKFQLGGGPPTVLCDAAAGRGGTWNAENVIVFAPAITGALHRVSAAGGVSVPLTTLDTAYGETNHRFPQFLPDGRHVVFTSVTGPFGSSPKPALIKVTALDSTSAATLIATESSAVYSSGYLLYNRDGTLMAQPFEPASQKFTGDAFPIAEQIATEGSRYGSFSVSPTGVLVFARGPGRASVRPTWYDRSGRALGSVGDAAFYSSLALSPDGRRAAVTLASAPPNRDIWILDLVRSASSRLTFDPADEAFPVWSPDGTRIVFESLRAGAAGLAVKPASGNGTDEVLLKADPGVNLIPTDWSRDGLIAYSKTGLTAPDVWVLRLSGNRAPSAVVSSPFVEDTATFSPDGRWIAYSSNESGMGQIYVQPFPPTGGKYLISRNGGLQPQWRRDGRELFFLGLDGTMMAARIDTSGTFEAGIPEALFLSGSTNVVGRQQYGVTADGQRFLVLSFPVRSFTNPLNVVVNWPATLQK